MSTAIKQPEAADLAQFRAKGGTLRADVETDLFAWVCVRALGWFRDGLTTDDIAAREDFAAEVGGRLGIDAGAAEALCEDAGVWR